jgi:aspartokinase/homoserine dehydrogenase 1
MENGFHIVTPNKKMGSGPLQDYLALRELSKQRRLHWFTGASPLHHSTSPRLT